MYIDKNLVQHMKEQYPPGTRIELDFIGDDPRPIAPGTKGTVRVVDDIGTVHCDFDNGRRLGLIPGEDAFHTVKDKHHTLSNQIQSASARSIKSYASYDAKVKDTEHNR